MTKSIQRFWQDENGAEMVEWAIVTVVLLVATTPVLLLLRDQIIEATRGILMNLQEDPKDEWAPVP
ncbi:MAG: Flp family type IVb pilin [Anaerolineae bacterium]|jgi:Flp pilus assembly pilin Flp|nr:hypothetical protein [Ardenticatenia bacterium]MBK8540694.1 hypothetical protein [Ardenticatenia bacterium]HQZ70671.1 hypothetical protein [Anaerolineae bacterium]HRA19434.1 hypothetical protein [Anaerolineae bacterium]